MNGSVLFEGSPILSGSLNVNTGGNIEPLEVEINENGTREITPPSGVDGYAPITIDTNVPIPEPVLDTLNVTSNGTYTPPSGVDGYDEVNVNVPQPTPVLDDITITANGTYTAPAGTGYNEVNVNVPLPSNAYLLKELSNLPQPIASFNDGAEDLPLKSLTASIVPVQSGSGDPSPTNVRPISGWTEEVVSVRGKNNVDGGTLTPSASNTNYPISPTLAKGNYVLSFDVSNLAWTNLNNTSFAWTKDSNNTQKDLLSHSIKRVSDNAYLKDLTQPVTGRFYGVFSNVEVASLVIACRNNTYMNFTSGTITNIQLESGSTPSDFEPYEGTTTTIPFTDSQGNPVEVYGGSVDVVNGGEQPRTLGKFIIDENTTIYTGSSGMPFRISIDDIKRSTSESSLLGLSSNQMKEVTQSDTWGDECTMSVITNSDRIFFKLTNDITTVADLKTYLEQHPIEIVYPLATPTTFNTQPTSIKSLDGENNVFASTGDVEELKYFSDH